MGERPSIIIHGFETSYKKNPKTGEMREIEWVKYSPMHSAMFTQIKERVDWLKPENVKVQTDDENGSKKMDFFRWRWEMIERAYNAWKSGHEIPIDGTPLGAWPGLNTAQADVFRAMGIKSVEQIAEMTDSIMGRVQLPGVRDIQKQARTYLESTDRNTTANRLTELEANYAALMEQHAAAMALLEEQGKPKKAKAEKEAA